MLPQDTELRVIRLEENMYFLEERLKALDKLAVDQQAQLGLLEKQLKDVAQRLKEINELLSDQAPMPPDGPPPHHVPRFW